MENQVIIELLRTHYRENVVPLPAEPKPKFKRFVERLKKHPDDFVRMAAEGLNGATAHDHKQVCASDLKECELFEVADELSLIAILIPKKKARAVMKKYVKGVSTPGHGFKKGSPFYGINVIWVVDDEARDIHIKHEKTHVIRSMRRHCLQEEEQFLHRRMLQLVADVGIAPYQKRRLKDKEKVMAAKRKLIELKLIEREMSLISEMLACGIAGEKKNRPEELHMIEYVIRAEQCFIRMIKGLGYPPIQDMFRRNCVKNKKLENSENYYKMCFWNYFWGRVEAGIRTLNILRKHLSEEELARVMISCGPTVKELKSGKYVLPLDELALWKKNYAEVLKKKPELHTGN